MAGKRKGTYRITNWRKYNESLVQRGSITFWFRDDVIEQWRHANDRPKVGHPFVYSDTAVECLLTLRELFQLPYRQNPKTQEIEAETLTENGVHDADQVDNLLEQIDGPVDAFYGDGAYDQWKVYGTLETKKIRAIIPPRRNAKIKRHGNSGQPPLPRDQSIREIRRKGRALWKESVGYHRRSLSETAMHRMKCCFGNKLKNHLLPNQRAEVRVRSKILNHFTHLGLPQFEWN